MKLKIKDKKTNIQEDSFVTEIMDELKEDNWRKIWDKYGLYLIIFIAVVLTATVSFESVRTWRLNKYQELTDNYSYAVGLQNNAQFEASLKIFEDIKNSRNGMYADMANLQIANVYFEQQKIKEALAVLKEIIDNKKANDKIKDVAIIKLASYMLDNAKEEEVMALLQPVADENSAFSPVAKEMLAFLAVRENKIDDAIAIYKEISVASSAPQDLRTRALDMLSVLSNVKN